MINKSLSAYINFFLMFLFCFFDFIKYKEIIYIIILCCESQNLNEMTADSNPKYPNLFYLSQDIQGLSKVLLSEYLFQTIYLYNYLMFIFIVQHKMLRGKEQ